MPFNFKESPLPGSKAPETGGVKPNLSFRPSVFEVDPNAAPAEPLQAPKGDNLPVGTWTTITRQVEEVLTKGKK